MIKSFFSCCGKRSFGMTDKEEEEEGKENGNEKRSLSSLLGLLPRSPPTLKRQEGYYKKQRIHRCSVCGEEYLCDVDHEIIATEGVVNIKLCHYKVLPVEGLILGVGEPPHYCSRQCLFKFTNNKN